VRSITTIYNYTRDLPRKHSCIPIEQRYEIYDKVRSGIPKAEVAASYNRSLRTIQTVTKDIPGYQEYSRTMGEEEKRLLLRLLLQGYVVSDYYISTARNLKLQLPLTIRAVRISHKTMFYVTGKEKEAIKGYLDSVSTRMIDHGMLKELCHLFGVKLSGSEEDELLHRRKYLCVVNQPRPTIQKKMEDFGSEPVYRLEIKVQEAAGA